MENSVSQSPVIRAALGRCGVLTVHLTVDSPERVRSTRKYSPKVTGVLHRNTGLRWVREHCSQEGWDDGVVYFGDDDDRYDLRFFDEVRSVLETLRLGVDLCMCACVLYVHVCVCVSVCCVLC